VGLSSVAEGWHHLAQIGKGGDEEDVPGHPPQPGVGSVAERVAGSAAMATGTS
jgi:hypothetical protein